jgi:serine/threonine protein phosphatase PrpC
MLHDPREGILARVAARRLALLGRDYPALGPVGVARLPGAGALALSRGAERKPYRHVDPNEDAALLVADDAGVLLAVADGFNGVAASEIALRAVERATPELLVQDAAVFAAAALALVERIARRLDPESDSRTCLLVAVLSGTRCHFANVGDSSLYRARSPEVVTAGSELFLGPGFDTRRLGGRGGKDASWLGSFERAPGERVAVVTDGITNFARDPSALPQRLEGAATDVLAATAIVRDALAGGAGDNVAIVIAGS